MLALYDAEIRSEFGVLASLCLRQRMPKCGRGGSEAHRQIVVVFAAGGAMETVHADAQLDLEDMQSACLVRLILYELAAR